MTWLLFHESQHINLNHFALLGRAQICEGGYPPEFGLVSRRPARRDILEGIDPEDWYKIEPCLEMQADHDAIELTLESYGPDGWDILRERAAAISAMMMLIERADAERDHEHSTHPRAATRIFQLLGHIAEMPTLPARFKAEARGDVAIDPADLPPQEEQEAFNREVVMPCFEDAVALAKSAGATTIIQDLGSAEEFFKDVEIARLMDGDRFGEFKTSGAKEWADLVEFNAVLLQRLGLTD